MEAFRNGPTLGANMILLIFVIGVVMKTESIRTWQPYPGINVNRFSASIRTFKTELGSVEQRCLEVFFASQFS